MSSARACVSVIDDDALVLRSLDRLLQARGFEVHTYSSPQAFLEQRDAETPGCIVMDLSMPGLSGLELQQALAGAADRRPVVFISGRGSVEVTRRMMVERAAAWPAMVSWAEASAPRIARSRSRRPRSPTSTPSTTS